MSDNRLSVLLQMHDDTRNELKQRISQRDNFAIQLTVLIIALLTIAFSSDNKRVATVMLLLLPLVSMFYSFLIDSSYRVHSRLVEYLKNEIEPKIKEIIGEDIELWEGYCARIRKMEIDSNFGGRQLFFRIVAYMMPLVSIVIQIFIGDKTELIITAVFSTLLEISYGIYHYSNKWRFEYTGLNKLAFCDYERKERLTDEPNKAVFLDRDGTLHVDKVMTHKRKDLELLPGAKDLVKQAHEMGYKIIIVTNQSAIGKGYYSTFRMHLFNNKLRRKLKYVDAIYFCPHLKDVDCLCHKPGTGMIYRAKQKYNLNLDECIMIGDRMSDIETADRAGIPSRYFVTTGIYNGSYKDEPGFYTIEHKTVHSLKEIVL